MPALCVVSNCVVQHRASSTVTVMCQNDPCSSFLSPSPLSFSSCPAWDLRPWPIVSRLFHGSFASGSCGQRKTRGGSRSLLIFLRHQLLRSGWRKIDACAKRDSSPRSLCPNPRSLGGGQPKQCRPEQTLAAPGTLGFIPVGLGCGEYFRLPGRVLELVSREGKDSCSLVPLPSYSSLSPGRSGWGLVGSDAVFLGSLNCLPHLPALGHQGESHPGSVVGTALQGRGRLKEELHRFYFSFILFPPVLRQDFRLSAGQG